MKKFAFLALALLALASQAQAVEVTIEWTWPDTYCDGTPLPAAEIERAEVFIDIEPITSSSDIERDSCARPADVPPVTEIVETVTAEDSLTVDLAPGFTYYMRMRVLVNGQWSNLSAQAEARVDFGMPKVPVIIRIGP